VSGAVQALRWTPRPGGGYIHSFNGAHSLFVDTIRSLRALALSHRLGHRLLVEQDVEIDLFQRLLQHASATAEFSVYYGRGRDTYDRRGRVAHESLFNPANGTYRGPNSQQGYSPFSTWTRGLAWAMLGFAEQVEFLDTVKDDAVTVQTRSEVDGWMLEAARATATFYIEHAACADGIPYWDTGAPGLANSKAGPIGPRIRSTTSSPWTVPRRRSPLKDCCDSAPARSTRGIRRSLHAGRLARARDALRCERSVSQQSADHQGLILHFDLPPAQWLGSRAERLEDPARRVEPVGRLSRARSGAVRQASRRRRAVSHLLRSRGA
jgi:hypothetical protein